MPFLSKSKLSKAADTVTRPSANSKPWQHMTNDIREACHRLKTIITCQHLRLKTSKDAKSNTTRRRSKQASVDGHDLPKKTGLLRPLKRVWTQATSKSLGNKSREDPSTPSNVATPDEYSADFSDSSSFSLVSDHARLLEHLNAHTRPRLFFRSTPNETSNTVVSESNTTKNSIPARRGRFSKAPRRSRRFVTSESVSHTQSASQHDSLSSSHFDDFKSAVRDDTISKPARRYPRKRREAKTLPSSRRTYSQYHSTTLTQTLTPSPPEAPLTVSFAEYDRIMNAVYRAAPSRIPIPVFWQTATPRAYNFRGPSSPYQDVQTVPLRAHKARTDSAFATAPQTPPSPWSSLSPSPSSAPLLRAIAARPTSRFPTHTRPVTEQTRHQRHVDSCTLGHRPKECEFTRLHRQKTLPRDWRLKTSSRENGPPMPASSRVLSGSNHSRFLPPVTLNDDGEGEDVWCREASVYADGSSIQACDSANTPQSCVSGADGDEDVWMREASRSDVAVVDEPMH